jgi:lysophospholipase L1-like esterase
LLIDRATALAQHKQLDRAIDLFRLGRASLTARADPKRIAAAVANTQRKLVEEREDFRRRIDERAPSEGPSVVVIADSLGLPRAEEASLPDAGIPLTYADKIQNWSTTKGAKVPLRVHALCQRYFTTDNVVQQLTAMRMSLSSAYVLVHVGLNDCATRIFTHTERLAVGLLDESTQHKLLDFVRTYRRPIVHRYPEYNYVDLPSFNENLEKAVKLVRSHKGAHIAFVTIVQPRFAAERHTPHLRWNFTRYNWAIYDVAKRMSVDVIDADRLCWAKGLDQALNPDGIHLSAIGHDMMADTYLNLIAPRLAAGMKNAAGSG